MGKAIGLLLVAVVSGTLLYFLLRSGRSRPLDTPGSRPPAPVSTSQALPMDAASLAPHPSETHATPPETDVSSAPPISPPRSPEESAAADLEAKRGPFYAWIRKEMSALLAAWQPSSGHPATLELYATQNDPSVVLTLQQQLVAPYAARYGFDHVLFYLLNPPGSLERYRLDSEASLDSNGSWNLIRK